MRLRTAWVLGFSAMTAWSWLFACGSDSEDSGFDDTPEEDGGSGDDASSATGGSSSGSGGSGGSQSTGGARNTGGSAGSTGGSGGAGDCDAPASATDAAICLTLSPEMIDFDQSDPAFDGSGTLVVQVFDRPDPPSELEDTIALYSRAWPPDALSPDVSLTDLPSPRIVLSNAPSTVYVRVLFADNPAIFVDEDIIAGTWVGGIDLSEGLVEGVGLSPVSVTRGEGTELDLPLTAFRELTVTVNVSATPIGDGEGPLAVIAVDSEDVNGSARSFGFATGGCVDVADAPLTATGVILGDGPYWVTGSVNDLGASGDLPPGTLIALDYDAATMTATIPHQLTIEPGAYRIETTIDLNMVAPIDADAGAIGPNACADIAPGDGGT